MRFLTCISSARSRVERAPRPTPLLLATLMSAALLCLPQSDARAQADELAVLDGFVSVSVPSGARYSRRTRSFNAYVEVRNDSTRTFLGPLRLAVTALSPAGVALVGPDGMTLAGDPYVELLPESESLSPGEVLTTVLAFDASPRARLRFSASVLGNTFAVSAPGLSGPGGLAILSDQFATTDLLVSVETDAPGAPVTQVVVERLDGAETVMPGDDGASPDASAGDGTFTGLLSGVDLSTEQPSGQPDRCLQFQAVASNGLQQRRSAIAEICVTQFTLGADTGPICPPVLATVGGAEAPVCQDQGLLRFAPGVTEAQIAGLQAPNGFTVIGTPLAGWYQVLLAPQPVDGDALLARLASLQSVAEVAEALPNSIGLTLAAEVAKSDARYAEQDALRAINAPEAWNVATGAGQGIRILDTGFDVAHEDLATVTGDADTGSHGTEVTGIVAATHNADGIAGATTGATVQSLDFTRAACQFGVSSCVDESRMATAIQVAGAAPGVDVINVSWGWPTGTAGQLLCNAVKGATATGKFVVAAVNNAPGTNTTGRMFPAGCNINTGLPSGTTVADKSRIIAVAGTDSAEASPALWPSSASGVWVDLAAPAVDVLTTVPGNGCGTGDGTCYARVTGNSYAAALVSSAVAILRSAGVPAADVESTLKATGAPIAGQTFPRVDLLAALRAFRADPTVGIASPGAGASFVEGDAVTLSGTAADAAGVSLSSGLAWSSSRDGALGAGASLARVLTPGSHVLTATATDVLDETGSAAVSVTVAANAAPVVSLTSPMTGLGILDCNGFPLTASASDAEDGDLSSSIVWTSSLDGGLGSGASIAEVNLSTPGVHVITASVTDSRGKAGSATATVTVAANTAPSVTITSPASGASFVAGTSVSFSASASDAQDGVLSSSLAWTANGSPLGSGASFSTAGLAPGSYTVTARATDSCGVEGSASVPITITPVVTGPTDLVSCIAPGGVEGGGDRIDRGFYVSSYPGSTLDEVELYFSAGTAGSYSFRLTAFAGQYDGPVLGSADVNGLLLSGNDSVNESARFVFGSIPVPPGNVVAFRIEATAGPSSVIFYSVGAGSDPAPSSLDPADDTTPGCPVIETEGTTPPLDTGRRNDVDVRIIGFP